MPASLSHGIDSVVLTTCNRFELYWRSRSSQDDILATSLLAAVLGVTDGTIGAALVLDR